MKKYLEDQSEDFQGIFLETAHPVKFLDIVESVIDINIEYPEQINKVINKTKEATFIETYDELKNYLLQ